MKYLDALLARMQDLESSDLHIKCGKRPRYRIDGSLEELHDARELSAEEVVRMISEILTEEQESQFRSSSELDFSYTVPEGARFRCNVFEDHRGPAAVFRMIPSKMPTLAELNLPSDVEALAHLRRGLVLVTGSSGTGKTTTLTALLDIINSEYNRHIVTLEDPIEYIHSPKKSVIHQRGMYYDIVDWASGIDDALHQDVDVLLIGELRDVSSVRRALHAAEIGALVFSTLHTNGAAETIDRIIDLFPSGEQRQVRSILSQCLGGVLSQALLRRSDGSGRYPATEILRATPAVRNLIREGKTQDLISQMQSGRSHGMHTLDDALEELVMRGVVDLEEAYTYASNKVRFESLSPVAARAVRRR